MFCHWVTLPQSTLYKIVEATYFVQYGTVNRISEKNNNIEPIYTIDQRIRKLSGNNEFIIIHHDEKGSKTLLKNDFSIHKQINTGIDDLVQLSSSGLVNRSIDPTLPGEHLGLFDIEDEVYKWKLRLDFNNYILYNDLIITHSYTEVTLISVDNGDVKWQYTLPPAYDWVARGGLYPPEGERQPAQIERIIGAYRGVVWIGLNTGRLLGLGTQTGELLHDISSPVTTPEGTGSYIFSIASALSPEQGRILGAKFQFYWEIDLNAREPRYSLHDLSEELARHELDIDMPGWVGVFDATHLYFYDSSRAVVGAIERATRRVVWTHRLEVKGAGLAKLLQIQYLRGRLYVLDATSHLHIFQSLT